MNDHDFEISIAQSLSERCQAFSLVYRKYLESNFIAPHTSGLFFSLLDVQPTTTCWIISKDHQVIGTMSMVLNGTAGLPGGVPFERDLRAYGVDGRIIAEFTKLALNEQVAGTASLSLHLMAQMIAWSWTQHIDDLVCVVHPRHAKTWSHVFGWKILGDVKGHGGVNNNPGVLIHLDLKRIGGTWSSVPDKGKKLLEQSIKSLEGHYKVFRPSGSELVLLLLQRPNLITSDNPAHRTALEKHFPWAMWLVKQLLEPAKEANDDSWSKIPRPRRDRSVLLPNQMWRIFLQKGGRLPENVKSDQLMHPDAPLVLLVGNINLNSVRLVSELEKAGYIVYFRECTEGIIRLIEENVFDIVLMNDPVSDLTIEIAMTIRARDFMFGMHTPIISTSELIFFALPRVRLLIPDHSSIFEWSLAERLTKVFALMMSQYACDENSFDEVVAENDYFSLQSW